MASKSDELVDVAMAWFTLGKKDRQIAIQLCMERNLLKYTDHFEVVKK